MSSRPSGGHNPNQLTQLQMPEQRLSLPENDAIQSHQVFEDQFQPEDKDNSTQDQPQQLSPKTVEQSEEVAFGVNKSTHDSVIQYEDDASGQMESTPYLVHQPTENASEPVELTHDLVHESGADACGPIESIPGLVQPPGEDACEPMELTHGVVHQTREDASGPIEPSNALVHQVAADEAFPNASQEYSDPTNFEQEQEQEQEPEQHLKPLSLDGLPLNSQDKEYGDSTPMSYENQSPTTNRVQDNCQTANWSPSIVSPGRTQSPYSAQIQNESVNPSSAANHLNPSPEQAQPEPWEPADGASSWNHIDNTVQASGNARSGFHGNSQIQQNQQRQVSPLQQCPRAEMGAQTLGSQGYSHHPLRGKNPQVQQGIQTQNQDHVGPARGNSTAAHSWPTQNLQQQNLVSVHQPQSDYVPASHSSAQMPQFPMQSGGQFGNAAYNQAYNQMMEYYFQQLQMMAQQHYNQQQQFTQQLQQAMPPHSASASGNAESPHPQQQYQGPRPPHRAAASGSAVTPHQPSRGVSPECASPSEPASSPYNKQ
ncbi:hypothetical protein Acr_06g0006320 [Actinidia rufa]|uniref:Uncharacterized protein n=1 Tax=Actinidia rufa TaxID=165716 RepID=A0A7J0EQU2_9ERIC|nr:hypothetical protein Acr_06g0006320 [Actinidia rufa]